VSCLANALLVTEQTTSETNIKRTLQQSDARTDVLSRRSVRNQQRWPFSLCYCINISSFWTTTTCNKTDIWKMAKIMEQLYWQQTSVN